MNNKTKRLIIKNLDPDKEYTCIYGPRRELFNIDALSLSGQSSSGNYKIFYFQDDMVDLNQLHSISINIDLFNGEKISKVGLTAGGINEVNSFIILCGVNQPVMTENNIDGCWALETDSGRTFWSFTAGHSECLYSLTLDKDDNLVIGPPLGSIVNDILESIKYDPVYSVREFIRNTLPSVMEFVNLVQSTNIEEIKNQIRNYNVKR